jgi:carbon monoxide dehydrogenase subunit G
MTVKVTIDLNRKLSVAADIDTVFLLLSDVPASAEHFPKVQAITALPDNSFRWDMEKVGLGTHSIQTIYACVYVSDSNAQNKSRTHTTVTWITQISD